MPRTVSYDDIHEGIPFPLDVQVNLQAGPSATFEFDEAILALQAQWDQTSHRDPKAKELLMATHTALFDLIGVPAEQRNTEWHIAFTNSGSDGIARSIRALCKSEGTLLVDTDNFSTVAGNEMKEFYRDHDVMKFPRGNALKVGTPQFNELAIRMKSSQISTLYLTENATTTGANQQEAIEALVQIRNESGSSTVIITDMVSSPILGKKWNPNLLPDAFFMAGQKDMGVGPGIGQMVFNTRALQRERENHEHGLDTGGKLGLKDAYGEKEKRMASTGQTPQTPPLGLIFRTLSVLKVVQNEITVQNIMNAQREARNLIRKFVAAHDLTFLTEDPELQSQTVSVLQIPAAKKVVAELMKRGIAVAGGYGKGPDDKEIRLCHYAASTLEEVMVCLDGLEEILKTS